VDGLEAASIPAFLASIALPGVDPGHLGSEKRLPALNLGLQQKVKIGRIHIGVHKDSFFD
jgi:hypothetical protein